MKRFVTTFPTLAVAIGLLSGAADAASVTRNINFEKETGLFGGSSSGFGFSESGRTDIGIGTLFYDVGANTGTVDAYNYSRITANYDEVLSFGDAADAKIGLSLDGADRVFQPFPPLPGINLPNSGFSTSFGAGVEVGVEDLFGLVDWSFIDAGARVEASAGSFGNFQLSMTGTDRDTLAGVGPDLVVVSLTANADVKQTSTLTFGNLIGNVRATHSSGETREARFDFATSTLLGLDLQKEGFWDLDLIGVDILNTFRSSFSLIVKGEACAFFECGSLDVAEVTFANISPFSIDFAAKNVDIGGITVLGAPVPAVPLPAGLPLMLAGLGSLVLVRRRT